MPTIVSSLLRAAVRRPDVPLNIGTFCTHERYETGLCRTNNNFYAWRSQHLKDWNRTFAPVPDNYTLLDPEKGDQQLPPDVVFDVILSQNKFGQFDIAKSLAKSLHIPHIHLEHTLPHPDWGRSTILAMKNMRADLNLFISDYSRAQWLCGPDEGMVVHHGVDAEVFALPPADAVRRPVLLSVVNDWIKRDWCCGFKFWREVTQGLPCFVVGDTPDLSKAASTTEELVWRYQTSQIFVNTSTVSPIPTALLEAMACGCAVVSTDNCMIPEIIKNGVNGYRTNDKAAFRSVLEHLLNNPDECARLGNNARRTVEDLFSMQAFVSCWNTIFSMAADIVPFTKSVA